MGLAWKVMVKISCVSVRSVAGTLVAFGIVVCIYLECNARETSDGWIYAAVNVVGCRGVLDKLHEHNTTHAQPRDNATAVLCFTTLRTKSR